MGDFGDVDFDDAIEYMRTIYSNIDTGNLAGSPEIQQAFGEIFKSWRGDKVVPVETKEHFDEALFEVE